MVTLWVLLFLSISLLAGCGQKGDLYLPDSNTTKKELVKVGEKAGSSNKNQGKAKATPKK